MYALIKGNIGALLDLLDSKGSVMTYTDLLKWLRTTDVSSDKAFQQSYSSYWRLNAARLNYAFYTEHFSYLERVKKKSPPTVEAVARHFLTIPSHGKTWYSVQFSFSSKLAHILNPDLPVYDSLVEAFYFLPKPPAAKQPERKLQKLLNSYHFLQDEYQRVINNQLLDSALEAFRNHFSALPPCSDAKIIDALIWAYVAYLRGGAITRGKVTYA